MNSPIAQDSAAQSPGQVSDPSPFQRAGENMVQKCPESPWIASELEEASKRQDLAIQKHNVKKAALERGIKRHLDYEPEQPSKKPEQQPPPGHPQQQQPQHMGHPDYAPLEAAEGDPLVSMPVEHRPKKIAAQNDVVRAERDIAYWESDIAYSEPSFYDEDARSIVASRCSTDDVQTGDADERRNKQPDLEYASEGPASSGRSFTHWLLRRRPSSFGSVMNGMFKKFERLAISVGSARKSRDKEAVPVEDSVNK